MFSPCRVLPINVCAPANPCPALLLSPRRLALGSPSPIYILPLSAGRQPTWTSLSSFCRFGPRLDLRTRAAERDKRSLSNASYPRTTVVSADRLMSGLRRGDDAVKAAGSGHRGVHLPRPTVSLCSEIAQFAPIGEAERV